jgi:hypothetical protein
VGRIRVFVITLETRGDRRASFEAELRHCEHEVVFGIDGARADMEQHWGDLQRFFGETRLRKSGLDSRACRISRANCDASASVHEQKKIALDLTYILLFRRIAKLSHPAVVFEDDITTRSLAPGAEEKDRAELSHAFLIGLMRELPRDWDLFMLHSSPRFEVGPPVSERIRILRSGVGTVAFCVTPEMAARFAPWAELGMSELYVDLLMNGFLTESGLVNGYIAQPFVVQHQAHFRSSFE